MSDTSNNVSAGCSADLSYGEDQTDSVTESDDSVENLPQVIEKKFAVILLKLEHIFHIPAKGVDELLEELQFLLGSASVLKKKTILQAKF